MSERIEDLDLEAATKAFKRYRYLAVLRCQLGSDSEAMNALRSAAALKSRIVELGGPVPY